MGEVRLLMGDVSKELWYIQRTIIQILNDFPGKVLYTTGSVREKYQLDSYTQLLTQIEREGPKWARLRSRSLYIPPKDVDPEDYMIIYELFMNKKFYMNPGIHEPENHPYIVTRNNSQLVEIKLFKFIDRKPILLKDYDQEMKL